jgi:hypothetical protein
MKLSPALHHVNAKVAVLQLVSCNSFTRRRTKRIQRYKNGNMIFKKENQMYYFQKNKESHGTLAEGPKTNLKK